MSKRGKFPDMMGRRTRRDIENLRRITDRIYERWDPLGIGDVIFETDNIYDKIDDLSVAVGHALKRLEEIEAIVALEKPDGVLVRAEDWLEKEPEGER